MIYVRLSRAVQVCAASIVLAACGDSGGPQPIRVSIRKLSGDGQTDTVLATIPLQVRITGSGNEPIRGTSVFWREVDGPSGWSDSDANGVASYAWTLPNTNTPSVEIDATAPGADSAVSFSVRLEGGRPVAIGKEFQGIVDSQIGEVGKPVFWPYGVYGIDGHGNDNASGALDIVWNVTAGGGAMVDLCGTECWCELPAAKCVFYHSARHILGPAEGANTVTASAPQLPDAPPLTFTAVGVTALVEVRAFNAQKTKDAAFEPSSVTIAAGQTVGWLWVGDFDAEHNPYFEKHDVVFEDSPTPPASSMRFAVGHHVRKFLMPGQYRYRCSLHSTDFTHGEIGVVTVTSATP